MEFRMNAALLILIVGDVTAQASAIAQAPPAEVRSL
jgi:hypothetical protein